jgi:hypothetical protein
MQLAYVRKILGMKLVYLRRILSMHLACVRTLHMQQGAYTIQKLVF